MHNPIRVNARAGPLLAASGEGSRGKRHRGENSSIAYLIEASAQSGQPRRDIRGANTLGVMRAVYRAWVETIQAMMLLPDDVWHETDSRKTTSALLIIG